MRVVQINYAFDPGVKEPAGLLERYVTLTGWSEALLAAGIDVSVMQRFHRDDRVIRNGIEYVFCADGPAESSAWFSGRRVARAVAPLQPDLVHVNGLEFGLPTWALMRQLPKPTACIVQHHGGGVPSRDRGAAGRVAGAIRRGLLASVDSFFFSTTEQAEPWRQIGVIGSDQSVHAVMEASTSMEPFDRREARHGGSPGSPALLWVGRLDDNKDPLTVLTAFEQALLELPKATLTVAFSGGPLSSQVQERVHRSPALRHSVRLVGSIMHSIMPRLYSAADLFVLGSHHEGSGYALLEASACGCVPIVTNIPSFRAITNNGRLGVSWTPGDVDGCRRAMVSAARSDLTAARAAVRDHFERELSWTAVGRVARRAYQDVIARKRLRLGVPSPG
jgi:glycosyltransferase involved in cell wall biosynthesis